jgi:hypothetical protein
MPTPGIVISRRQASDFLLRRQVVVDPDQLGRHLSQLFDEVSQCMSSDEWNSRIRLVFDHRGQQTDIVSSVRADYAELRKVAADGVEQLRSLADQRLLTR